MRIAVSQISGLANVFHHSLLAFVMYTITTSITVLVRLTVTLFTSLSGSSRTRTKHSVTLTISS